MLQANHDTLLGQLRSPDPDVLIVERATTRVMSLLNPASEALAVFEASGLAPDVAQGAADRLTDLGDC